MFIHYSEQIISNSLMAEYIMNITFLYQPSVRKSPVIAPAFLHIHEMTVQNPVTVWFLLCHRQSWRFSWWRG